MVSAVRYSLLERVNDAFSAENIAQTSRRAAGLPATADAFDIVHALELFDLRGRATLASYRRNTGIPPVILEVLAAAFRHAIASKTPLSFSVVGGHAFGASVTVSRQLISVHLTRID